MTDPTAPGGRDDSGWTVPARAEPEQDTGPASAALGSAGAEQVSSSTGSLLDDELEHQSTGGGRHAPELARQQQRSEQQRARRSAASERRAARHPLTTGQKVVRGLGELLITAGLVLLLLVVYEVYVTDLFSSRKQNQATAVMEQEWRSGGQVVTTVAGADGAIDPDEQVVDPATRTKKYDTSLGEGFAKIYIPTFGTDWARTVIEGTDPDELYIGPGHYVDTQYPGEQGNFAVAGHRVSKGSPFNDLDLLNACDAIVVETVDNWFIYRVLPMQDQAATWNAAQHQHCAGVPKPAGEYANVFGRTIVLPSDGAVVNPVPGSNSTAVPKDAERLITLTTCHPQFSDAERMIVHGILVRTYAKENYADGTGFRPPELDAES